MQYPSQQPLHAHSLEINASQYPFAMPAQEIIIYPNRTQAIVRTILSGTALVFAMMILVSFITFIYTLGSTDHTNDTVPAIMYLVIIYLAIMLPMFVFGGWATWNMAQLFLNPTPLLIINRQGITVGKTAIARSFSIPWNEIEALHTSMFMYKYLCIRLKDNRQSLQRFNILERYLRLSNTLFGVPPLIIAQFILDRPVGVILQQVSYFYAHELTMHHIRLLP